MRSRLCLRPRDQWGPLILLILLNLLLLDRLSPLRHLILSDQLSLLILSVPSDRVHRLVPSIPIRLVR